MSRARRRITKEKALGETFGAAADDSSVAESVYRAVADAILSAKLPPGWRLREERLATLYNVSRTPVREALVRLEAQHLAERDRRSGLVVAGLTVRDIIEVYIVREALDGVAARQAARYGSDEDIAALEQLNQLIAASANEWDLATIAAANVRFHQLLASASRNSILQRFVEDIHRSVSRFHGTTFSLPGRAAEAIREHQEIIEAIRAHDEDRAERLAREHMRRALNLRMAMEVGRSQRPDDPMGVGGSS
jgi:DNA-binding GntR family transcriptional regulator